jgi:Zn-dependent protease
MNKFSITSREITEICISMLVLSLALFVALEGLGALFTDFSFVIINLGIILIALGFGFVLHELGHKFVAQYYGAQAEFRMWPTGLVLAFGMAVLVGVIFAAPGAVYIYAEKITKRQNGLISLAGPVVNFTLAIIFLFLFVFLIPFLGADSILIRLTFFGWNINAILGFFNMLPIGPLDGGKIMRWNFFIWGFFFLLGITLFFLPMFFLL